MIQRDDRFRQDPSIVSREIAGETILVPIRHSVGDLESIYTLNEVASTIWSLVDGQRSVAQIREAVVAEFEVDDDEAERDLIELLAHLLEIGAVERV